MALARPMSRMKPVSIEAIAPGTRSVPACSGNNGKARASIQIGRERQEVSAVVPQGTERDALWREVIEWKPFFQDYERKSSRVIPVAVLTPLGAGTS